MSDYTPTVGELRQAYVEASGASMAQESYYAEQVAEFERGIARIKAEAVEDGETIAGLRHDLALAREERVNLQEENDRLEQILQSPLSLRDLEVSWEAAEVPTDDAPIRRGDVVIEKISASAYAVMTPPPTCGLAGREFRVLSRAPREPWQDLADVLDQYRPTPDEMLGWGDDHLAAYLHERGVRVTGGDDRG